MSSAAAQPELLGDVLQCWRDVLGAGTVAEDRHFFLSGGDSLQMTRILLRVRQRLQVELRLQDLVEFSTPRKMAQWCHRLGAAIRDRQEASVIAVDQRFVASQSQQGLWLSELMANNRGLYNSGLALHLHGEVDMAVLRRALALLARQHPLLRGRLQFDVDRKQLLVDIAEQTEEVVLPVMRVSPAKWHDAAAATVSTPFVFAEALLRYQLFRLAGEHHVLLICCHHCIFDGWSGGVFLQNLSTAYRGLVVDRGWQPAMIDTAYATHCRQEQQRLQSPAGDERLQWWRAHLRSFSMARQPTPWQGSAEHWPYRWQRRHCELPPVTMQSLRALGATTGTTLFSCLMLALNRALVAIAGPRDYCIGFPLATRNSVEAERSIGCYMDMAFIRVTPEECGLLDSLRHIQAGLVAAQANALPLPTLIKRLQSRPLPDGNHWFDVVLALQNFPQPTPEFGGLTCREEAIPAAWGQYPLKFEVRSNEGSYWLEVCYAEQVVSTALLQQLLDAFLHALRQLAAVHAEAL